MRKIKQSTAKNVMVLMVDSTDHITGKTGLTLTITASKDGAAFASITPTVTERGTGWYNLALTTGHTDTLGDLALHITGAAADPADMVLLVEAGATDADVSSRSTYAGGAVASVTSAVTVGTINANVITAASINASAFNGKGDWNVGKTGYTLTATTGLGNQTANITGNLSGSVGSVTGLTAANLDVAVSSRLATAGYTAPDNATITTINGKLPALVGGRVDASVGAMAANVLTAAAINAGALNGKGDWNIGKTGYSLTATTGLGNQTANITGSITSVSNAIILPSIPANWITAAGINAAALNGKGDWNTAVPPSAVAIRTEIDANSTKLDAAVSSRMATFTYTAPPTANQNSDAVWAKVLP